MRREIVLDTETTGLDPKNGDRVVEIGCVELSNFVPTGKTFHSYVNPQRAMHPDATAISGLTEEFLKDFPLFEEVAADFLAFIGEAPLVIHNAPFDIKFLNAELKRLDLPLLAMERAVDTLPLARRLFPGAPASLDALCRRFNVDNSRRTLHGALLDCELLAEVYVHLMGGKQARLTLEQNPEQVRVGTTKTKDYPLRTFAPSQEERAAHEAFCLGIKNPLWEEIPH
ncbi:MAG: DNA polymerase III subunit epsilon [Holosporales bacterium]|jgi:DNA polymerase-3 subunit epsilon|nr:DNA polymerase III subunit epsilon [Holosporales bacterium]